MARKSPSINVPVDAPTKARLLELATRSGMKLATYVRWALTNHLMRKGEIDAMGGGK